MSEKGNGGKTAGWSSASASSFCHGAKGGNGDRVI